MARDAGLEELVRGELGGVVGLTEKAMFGGWAFLLHGNLLCGVRKESVMLRVGKENEGWALSVEGVEPVVMRGRRMSGYVRALPEAYAEGKVLSRLVEAAVGFVGGLERK
jgi:hypothetical protein